LSFLFNSNWLQSPGTKKGITLKEVDGKTVNENVTAEDEDEEEETKEIK